MTHTVRLPGSWASAKLGDILPIHYGKGLTKAKRNPEGDVPVYGSSGVVGTHDAAITSGPTLIIGRKGSVGTVHRSPQPCWPIDTVYFVEETSQTLLGYFEYLLKHLRLNALDRSTTIPGLSRDDYNEVLAPIAPLQEQRRIVEAIESYLLRLDDAVASLERVQRNLERYRASVLKAAVEGRLVPTEASLAREEGRSYEPASVLLEHILVERKKRWIEDAAEKARAKAEAKALKAGKAWTQEDDEKALENARKTAEAKYKEPEAPDLSAFQSQAGLSASNRAQAGTTNLPTLPEGWCWATMESITVSGPQNGIYVHKSLYGEGTPILRIDDYQIDLSRSADELQRVSLANQDRRRYMLQVRDLVINRVNSPSHLGKSMVVESRHVPAVFESNMMRLELAADIAAFFVQAFLSSAFGKSGLTENAKWAVNQASINQRDVGRTAVPLPPTSEQQRIVTELKHSFSITKAVRETISSSSAKSEKLSQSILKWAFEGKLVEQDPNDEPASELLERIKTEQSGTSR